MSVTGVPAPGPSVTHPQRAPRKRLRRGIGDRWLALLMLAPAGILLGVFELYPFVVALRDSFYQIQISGVVPDKWVGIQNYLDVLQDPATHDAFGRSLEFIVGSVVIQTILGLLTALVLDQALRGQLLWRGMNLFPYMVPAIVATLLFRFSFNGTYGIINYLIVQSHLSAQPVPFLTDPHTIMGVVIFISSWRHAPFMTIVFLARLQTVPKELIEASTVDGAGHVGRIRHVILPWLLPVMLIAMLLRTIWAGVEFDFPYLTAYGGPLSASTVVPIQIYDLYTQGEDVGRASALAVSVGILLAIAAIFYLRYYRKVESQAA